MSLNPIKYNIDINNLEISTKHNMIEYYDDNKYIKSVYYHEEKNKRNGVYKQYHKNGSLFFKMKLRDMRNISNRILFYYSNNNIKCDIYYKDGKMHGMAKGYYIGGGLAMEVVWNNGTALSGVYYNKNGLKKIMTTHHLNKKTIKNS